MNLRNLKSAACAVSGSIPEFRHITCKLVRVAGLKRHPRDRCLLDDLSYALWK